MGRLEAAPAGSSWCFNEAAAVRPQMVAILDGGAVRLVGASMRLRR